MPSLLATAIVGGATIGAIGSVAGAGEQASAANNAADLAQQRYMQTRADLAPYTQGGQQAFQAYNQLAPFSFDPTMQTLENLPGYQFTLQQGLKSTQNSAAARGLGASGAALKGAASYSTGLAASTWPQLFSTQLQAYQTNANKLLQGGVVGESAGAQTGSAGAALAQTGAQALTTAGGALSGGISSAAGQFSNALQNPALLNALTGGSGTGFALGPGGVPGGAPGVLAPGQTPLTGLY